MLLLAPNIVQSANLDWPAAKGLSFKITHGVEIGRNATGKPAAQLSFVCSAQGGLHLLLRTRLPIEYPYRKNLMGRVNDVWLYVGKGIERKIQFVFDVVAQGRGNAQDLDEWIFGIDDPDTIVTPQMSMEQVASLENLFGTTPPTRVSVVGIWETGVFMVGAHPGSAIRKIRENCVATSD
ncbi:hypothetical protein [Methylobacterium sp. NFXW15]|uniref:hypothetical protein n=1 Tax=Methylobacterium sp. NFXW15 TaxID=2819512 RepID=UPI003CF5670A